MQVQIALAGWPMGGGFNRLGRDAGVLAHAGAALLVFVSAAFADCAPVHTAAGCGAYISQMASGTCLAPGGLYVQSGNAWTAVGRMPPQIAQGQKSLKFFYLVDAGRTHTIDAAKNKIPKNGLVFVKIIRIFGIDKPSNVKLSQNKEFDFRKKFEEEGLYNFAVTKERRATDVLKAWGNIPKPEQIFSELDDDILKRFNFETITGKPQPTLHASLFRFDAGTDLMCIPFYVGVTSNQLHEVLGTVIDVLRTTDGADDSADFDFNLSGQN